jgi:4-amino-4-deoxy-L-arabinose transferase-like glycosyltransferase
MAARRALVFRPETAAALAALLLACVRLGEIPGFHGDEAWVLPRVQAIAAGEHRLEGMNSYTGSLHLYALWPVFEAFGYRLPVLRAAGAVAAAGTAAVLVAASRLPLFGAASPAWAAALLVTSPAFVLFSRFATEVTTLLPLLCSAGLLLVARGFAAAGARRALLAAGGGLLLGLATWTHVLFVAPPAAAALALLLAAPRRALREPALPFAAAGFALGFAPRLLPMLVGSGTAAWSGRLAKVASGRFARDFGELTGVLAGGLDGGLLYQRFVGGSWLPVVPYASGALLLVLALRLWRGRGRRPARRELALVAFAVLLADLVVVVTPGLALRYFLAVFLFAPLLLASLAAPLLGAGDALTRGLARGALAAVLALNVLYVSANYFVAFERTGGASSVFPLGKRQLETSNHFMRTDRLYAQLVERGIATVMAKDFIALPLAVYDLPRGALRVVEFALGRRLEPGPLPPDARLPAAVVYYAGPEVYRKRSWDPPRGETLELGPLTLRRDASFDPHFLVFVSGSE